MPIEISMTDAIQAEEVVELYAANGWSSAKKPIQSLSANPGGTQRTLV